MRYFPALLLVLPFIFGNSASAQDIDKCTAKLKELQKQITTSHNELNKAASTSREIYYEVNAKNNELLFFENELNQFGFAVSQHVNAELQSKAQDHNISNRLRYLYTLPMYPNVMNEISFLQNQQFNLSKYIVDLSISRTNLEIELNRIKRRVKKVRDALITKQDKLGHATAKQFTLDRQLANERAELSNLSSITGQDACATSELEKTKSKLEQTVSLVNEVRDLKTEAENIKLLSDTTKRKIDALLSKIEL